MKLCVINRLLDIHFYKQCQYGESVNLRGRSESIAIKSRTLEFCMVVYLKSIRYKTVY
jgi:hypothetical protein